MAAIELPTQVTIDQIKEVFPKIEDHDITLLMSIIGRFPQDKQSYGLLLLDAAAKIGMGSGDDAQLNEKLPLIEDKENVDPLLVVCRFFNFEDRLLINDLVDQSGGFTRLGLRLSHAMDVLQEIPEIQSVLSHPGFFKPIDHNALNDSSTVSRTFSVKRGNIPFNARLTLNFHPEELTKLRAGLQSGNVIDWKQSVKSVQSGTLTLVERQSQPKEKTPAFWVSAVAHELGNQFEAMLLRMNNLKTLINTLEGERKEQTAEYFEEIYRSIHQQLEQAREILSLYKLHQQGVDMGHISDLNEVVAGALMAADPINGGKHVSIQFLRSLESLSVQANDKLISQVIRNLLGNAVKYSPAGTSIQVRTFLSENKQFVGIKIKDQGAGISEDDRVHIFTAFFRSAANNKKVSGTGLGLTIVKSIIDLHGGTIECESDLGQGTTFTILLPVNAKKDA